jgi:hypothetical protein
MSVFSTLFALAPVGPVFKTVRLVSVAALPACTPAGTGVGHTLTADAVGILSVDATAVVLNDRVLVKNQVDAGDNGIYKCTTAGTAGVAFVLTRAIDFDAASASEITRGVGIWVTAGATKSSTSWLLEDGAAITVDTTDLNFVAGNGDTDVVNSGPISVLENSTIGAIVTIDETLAPLVGVLRAEVANGAPHEVTNGRVTWRPYGGLSVMGGAALTNGEYPVTGDEDFEFELRDIAFGWLRFVWVGTTGEGTISQTISAKRT